MKTLSAEELVAVTLLNPINNNIKPVLPEMDEPWLITNLPYLKGKEHTLIQLGNLLADQNHVELLLIPHSKVQTTEVDFLEQQLSFLESVDDNELQDTPTNREFVKLIQSRAVRIIESIEVKELILAFVTVCFFAENPIVKQFFPEADGLKLLVRHEMLYEFLTYVETDFFPDVEVDWKTKFIVEFYKSKAEENEQYE